MYIIYTIAFTRKLQDVLNWDTRTPNYWLTAAYVRVRDDQVPLAHGYHAGFILLGRMIKKSKVRLLNIEALSQYGSL
jgi:hypothetical protein